MEVILFVLLVVLSAVFSGFEMAYVSRSRLIHASNLSGGMAQFFGAEPRKVLITILIGNNIAITGATITLTHLFMGVMGKAASAASAALVATAVLLVFGEALPKAVGRAMPQRLVKAFAPAIYWAWLLMKPLVTALDRLVPGEESRAELDEALAHAGLSPDAVRIISLATSLGEERLGNLARYGVRGLRLSDGKALYKPPERQLVGSGELELPLYPAGAKLRQAMRDLSRGPVAVLDGERLGLVDAVSILEYFRRNGSG